MNLTPQRRAALKLQGRYMGHLKKLDAKGRARVKALKAQKGYPAALALAKRLTT